MQYIPLNTLGYRFNDLGETIEIEVGYSFYYGRESINTTVVLTNEYLQGINDKLDLDRLNKDQIDNYARVKLRDWILTTRPENEPEEEPTINAE